MSDIAKYMDQLSSAFPDAARSDVYSIGKHAFDRVGEFLTNRNATQQGSVECMTIANKNMSFDEVINAGGVEELQTLVKDCGIADA